MRGVLSIPPRSEPRFTDTAPTVEGLPWQLTQAVTTAEHAWVLEAMARHRHVAPPRKRPREPWPPPAQTPASPPRDSRGIHARPHLEQAMRVMLHAQTQAARLCLEGVAQALAPQTFTDKSLFLAHHHEHVCRQAYFLYKEHTARWYVEAQQAIYQLSWMADSRRLRFRLSSPRCGPRRCGSSPRHCRVGSKLMFRRPPASKRTKRPNGGICPKCTQ